MSIVEHIFANEARAWQELIQQAQASWNAGEFDRAGEYFRQLEDKSSPWLLRIARAKAPAYYVDEAVAETHLALLKMLMNDTPIQNVKGLLKTIIKRRIVDEYRRHGEVVEQYWGRYAETETLAEDEQLDQVEVRDTATRMANTILQELPPPLREILIARIYDELSVAQTAAHLGITEDQVKKRKRDALELARQIAQEKGLLR
jgi:RNA polymerase sigma factor (sigma-70 family)